MPTNIYPIYPPGFDFPFPSSYTNVYGAKLRKYSYKESANSDTYYTAETFDLEDAYTSNSILLRQNGNYEADESLGNIFEQSIVHKKIGVIPNGQQVRVTFYFSTPPGYPNKVQIFEGEELKDVYTTPLQDDWWEGSRTILVTGDGRTSIDVYFRPSSYSNQNSPTLFFNGIEMEVI